MADFRDLRVWKKSHQLTLAIYEATQSFPRTEAYGLTSQIRRSCSSIPANIAEGCGRGGDAEFARFCTIALGSASELDYHLLLAKDLKLMRSADYERLLPDLKEVGRMLTGLLKTLRTGRKKLATRS